MKIDEEIINILKSSKESLERKLYFIERQAGDLKTEIIRIESKLDKIKKGQLDLNVFKTAGELLDEANTKY